MQGCSFPSKKTCFYPHPQYDSFACLIIRLKCALLLTCCGFWWPVHRKCCGRSWWLWSHSAQLCVGVGPCVGSIFFLISPTCFHFMLVCVHLSSVAVDVRSYKHHAQVSAAPFDPGHALSWPFSEWTEITSSNGAILLTQLQFEFLHGFFMC